jgi:hypothetical protein
MNWRRLYEITKKHCEELEREVVAAVHSAEVKIRGGVPVDHPSHCGQFGILAGMTEGSRCLEDPPTVSDHPQVTSEPDDLQKDLAALAEMRHPGPGEPCCENGIFGDSHLCMKTASIRIR